MKSHYLLIILLAVVVSISGCKKKDPEPEPYATFTVNGTSKEYKHYSQFNKICITTYFCGSFEANENEISRDYLGIGLPKEVSSGGKYNTSDGGCNLTFTDSSGKLYNSYYGSNVTINISSWEGNGGWVKGTFSGTILSEADPLHDSVTITNGYFQNKIWYIGTK